MALYLTRFSASARVQEDHDIEIDADGCDQSYEGLPSAIGSDPTGIIFSSGVLSGALDYSSFN